MSRLSLNKKYITNINASASGSETYIFLGGSNNTIGTFLSDTETTFGPSGTGTEIIIYDTATQLFLTYLRRTVSSWRDGNNTTVNNLLINEGTIFIIRSPTITKNFTMQGTNLIQKYSNLGKTSIKKQNLGGGKTIINRTGLYKLISTGSFIFVRGDNNTIGTFSNASEFTGNNNIVLADRITIKSPGEGAFISYFLRADGITWRRSGSTTTQNDTVIPHGSIIQYTTYNSVLKEFTVQGNNVVRVNPNA